MENLNKAIGKAAEAFANLVKSLVEMAQSLANILLPVLKSNNWRKLHGLPMRRRRKPCGKRKSIPGIHDRPITGPERRDTAWG